MSRRELDVVVLSDIHLGTPDCQADALLNYLRHIKPKTLILNGDIIQMNRRRRVFPVSQMKIIDEILQFSMNDTTVYLITGNRDDELRQRSPISTKNLKLRDKVVLQLRGKQYWIFHGDIFDLCGLMTPWLVSLGSGSYRYLLRANRWMNRFRKLIGLAEMSLSAKLRKWPLKARQYIEQFESMAIRLTREKGFDVVICGHTHQPVIRRHMDVIYMNSGDWVENLTALEFNFGKWKLYRYHHLDYDHVNPRLKVPKPKKMEYTREAMVSSEELFEKIMSQVR